MSFIKAKTAFLDYEKSKEVEYMDQACLDQEIKGTEKALRRARRSGRYCGDFSRKDMLQALNVKSPQYLME